VFVGSLKSEKGQRWIPGPVDLRNDPIKASVCQRCVRAFARKLASSGTGWKGPARSGCPRARKLSPSHDSLNWQIEGAATALIWAMSIGPQVARVFPVLPCFEMDGSFDAMANPEHYSRDIALRCQSLIQHLLPKIEAGLGDETRFGGPLKTTFLLAMATPLILLPMERIFKPAMHRVVTANDRHQDIRLASLVDEAFGPTKAFGKTDFGRKGDWRYVANYPLFNVAFGLPEALVRELGKPEAAHAAMVATTRTILGNLRNALAHGGIAYLDKHGGQSVGEAAMFAFVAFENHRGRPVGLNVIRVSEDTFRNFLNTWTTWLGNSGVAYAMSEGEE
jgi:hypothetical protein